MECHANAGVMLKAAVCAPTSVGQYRLEPKTSNGEWAQLDPRNLLAHFKVEIDNSPAL